MMTNDFNHVIVRLLFQVHFMVVLTSKRGTEEDGIGSNIIEELALS